MTSSSLAYVAVFVFRLLHSICLLLLLLLPSAQGADHAQPACDVAAAAAYYASVIAAAAAAVIRPRS
jgi:predicted outer membrane protein